MIAATTVSRALRSLRGQTRETAPPGDVVTGVPPQRSPGTALGRIQLFLVSQNRLMRDALARLLRKKDDIYVVGTAPCGPEVAELVATRAVDVLLLNGSDEQVSVAPVVPELLKRLPRLKVVLLGMEESEPSFLRAVREGAAGYLLQDASPADVVAAVRGVMQGEAACPPRLCWTLFRHTARQACGMPSLRIRVQFGLTRRQQQLLSLIAEGLTNKEIASRLNLSEQTIKNHVHRILQRVGAEDRLTAVELCRNEGHLA